MWFFNPICSTRDFIDDFAKSLEKFDRIVLLDIYPAREKTIKGITSKLLLDKIKNVNKSLAKENELYELIINDNSEIIITMGAGSIGEICQSLKNKLVYEINMSSLVLFANLCLFTKINGF